METTQPFEHAAGSAAGLSLMQRLVAVFIRPGRAWDGLERRGQWWFPLLLVVIVSLVSIVALYQRAVVPDMLDRLERQVDSGQLNPETQARIEQQMTGPFTLVTTLVSAVVGVPLVTLVLALLPWVAAGFMLGRPLRFRDAFAVTAWAGLVGIPGSLLHTALAWVNESAQNVHIGFGALLPVADPPSKLLTGLGVFLDYGLGPFQVWHLVVLVLGTAALSGAPRRTLAWAVGGLWVGLMLIVGAVSVLFAPGA